MLKFKSKPVIKTIEVQPITEGKAMSINGVDGLPGDFLNVTDMVIIKAADLQANWIEVKPRTKKEG